MEQLPVDESRHNPNPETCSYFIMLKRRFCKMRVKSGAIYCGEHSILNDDSNRVPCPYDQNHTVEKDRLESHLPKCNSRPKPKAEFHREGINEAKQVADALSPTRPMIPSWMKLLEFMRDGSFTLEDYPYNRQHDLSTGKAGRHDLQNTLISEIIRDNLGTPRKAWIIELGAGKGGLSLSLAETYADIRGLCHFILADRANSRRKQDCFLRNLGASCQRIFIDLRDLDLDALLPECLEQVIFTGKHLCGEATCLSLRAIASIRKKRPNLHILVAIATCCHQLCAYQTFPWNEEHWVSAHDFDNIRRASSWYVCKNRIPKLPDDVDPITLGLYCKTFLDSLRVRFLSSQGFHVQYFRYVDERVSPENRIIVAHSPPEMQPQQGFAQS